MPSRPTFMYGPKDGALVPDMLWALDEIELQERTDDGIVITDMLLIMKRSHTTTQGLTVQRRNNE